MGTGSPARSWAKWAFDPRGPLAGLGLAALAGAVSVLAMAPTFYWPLLWLTFPALVMLLDRVARRLERASARGRAAGFAALGWAFGFGYFVPGLSWVGEAFLVEADKFAWMMPFAVTLMPAGLALFFASAAAAASLVWRPGAGRILALALALSTTEWLRGHILTGFPWNDLGLALTGNQALMQSASVLGVSGLAFWTVLVFASPVLLLGTGPIAVRAALPAVATGLLGLAALLGSWRVPATPVDSVAGIRLRLVQPNIPQREKWQDGNKERIFSTFVGLTEAGEGGGGPSLAGITHVIWPESSLPFLMLQSGEALARIGALLPDGRVLIAGSLRAEEGLPDAAGVRQPRYYNSLAAIDAQGRPLAIYDKRHLVPFGEYLPFQSMLEAIGLEQLTRLKGGFEAGVGPRRLEVPGAPPLIPLICYEAIFPGEANGGIERAGWLLNVTNDAWFGHSAGPYQHLHQARLRAVETGLPLVRVANTGISGVIDPYGRMLGSLALETRGIIDSPLPVAIGTPPYAQVGDLALLLQSLTGLLVLLALRRYVST